MPKIEFRYRPYKNPALRGTWMLSDGKQIQRISSRQLSRVEIANYRKTHILNEKGYLQTSKNTYRQQTADDHIREVNLGDLNDEVVDVTKDTTTGKWEKEGKEDRDYIDPEDIDNLEKVI